MSYYYYGEQWAYVAVYYGLVAVRYSLVEIGPYLTQPFIGLLYVTIHCNVTRLISKLHS